MQATPTYCQAACLYMVSEFYSQRVGWSDPSFINPDEFLTQNYIYTYIYANGGVYWYPNSQRGAPEAYSKFLSWHLYRIRPDSAYLRTFTSGHTALDWQLAHFKIRGCYPLITLTNNYMGGELSCSCPIRHKV